MVIGSANGGLRIPGWFLGVVTAVLSIIGATFYVLRDRADLETRLQQVEQRQCAVLNYLARHDMRFDSPIFKRGCS